MKQFLLPPDYAGQPEYTLRGKDYHYLCHVRRMSEGDEFGGIDHSGNRFRLRLKRILSDSCAVAVEPLQGRRNIDPDITLFQCLPRGTKMDLIVRQATETGVSRIVPVMSMHTVTRLDSTQREPQRIGRWLRIAREAVQQSGAPTIPEVHEPIPLEQIGKCWTRDKDSIGLFFHQSPLEQQSLHEYLDARPHRIAIVVGPEGGLSQSEIGFLRELGFAPVYLGSQVLRTETAALYAIAAVQIVYLEKKSWQIVQK